MDEDGLGFVNKVYGRVYDDYFSLYKNKPRPSDEQIRTSLMNSPDLEVSEVAVSIASERHLLSVEKFRQSLTAVTTQLTVFVPESIIRYHIQRLNFELQKIRDEIRLSNFEESVPLLKQFSLVNENKKLLEERLKAFIDN